MAKDQFVGVEVSSGGKPGTEFVTKQLRLHVKGYDNLQKLFEDLASAFFQYEERGYDRANIGASWGDLADSTIEQKRSQGYPLAILVRTGILRDSLTVPGGNFQIYNVRKTEMELGTSVDYAFWHQVGTRKMPRRMVIPTAVEFNDKAKTGDLMGKFQFGICREVYRR